jgi:hypothetical protein
MIGNLIAFLVATFLVEPLQSKLAEQLAGGRAPVAVVQQVEASIGKTRRQRALVGLYHRDWRLGWHHVAGRGADRCRTLLRAGTGSRAAVPRRVLNPACERTPV